MSVRRVMLAVAVLLVVSCSAPELATPGFTVVVTAPAGASTGHPTLECPAGRGTGSGP